MELQHELATVVLRMYAAGWPEPTAVSDTMEGCRNWQAIMEAIAERYLRSIDLRVVTLIQLGALAAIDLPLALDIAGWEEAPIHVAAEDDENE